MSVTYDYYRIFYYVAQYQSFTKAARVLGNNQPNVSRFMNNLEQELGCKLFVRSKRGVALTPEGKQLYSHVAVAFEQLRAGEEKLSQNRCLKSGLVSIGASETALHLLLLEKLENFHNKYPGVRLRISNHSTPQALAALKNGLVDFAVVTTPADVKKPLTKFPLHSFCEILIGGTRFANLASDMCSLQDLSSYPFICLGEETGTREFYQQFFSRHNLALQIDMEAATTDQILPMVEHNLGLGFVPEKLATQAITQGKVIQIRFVEPIPERSICLIRDLSRPQSIAVKTLEQVLCGF
jgi:DNA-binding transcriptional LysR family regulator